MSRKSVVKQTFGLSDEWTVTFEWPRDELHGGPVKLTVEPTDPGAYPRGGLSQAVLREITFQKAAAIHRSQATLNRGHRDIPGLLSKLEEAGADGRLTPHYLALLSAAYVEMSNSPEQDGSPVDELHRLLGRSEKTIQNHLGTAQRKGILAGRSAGRVGGSLTEQGEKLLAEKVGQ